MVEEIHVGLFSTAIFMAFLIIFPTRDSVKHFETLIIDMPDREQTLHYVLESVRVELKGGLKLGCYHVDDFVMLLLLLKVCPLLYGASSGRPFLSRVCGEPAALFATEQVEYYARRNGSNSQFDSHVSASSPFNMASLSFSTCWFPHFWSTHFYSTYLCSTHFYSTTTTRNSTQCLG